APRPDPGQARPPGPRRPGRPPRRDLPVRRQQRHLRTRAPRKLRRTKHMTTPADIDRTAPVIARHEIDINAPLDTVWNLHTDVDACPPWNQEMTTANTDGPFPPGNSFTWPRYNIPATS